MRATFRVWRSGSLLRYPGTATPREELVMKLVPRISMIQGIWLQDKLQKNAPNTKACCFCFCFFSVEVPVTQPFSMILATARRPVFVADGLGEPPGSE